ncbi:MAG: GerMN domain-containing protein [Leptolyngbyaceae cyanobacterium bins.349]|nr:GerMN domain-containing protein [Leptolyngbyaceae cyanobacterium bins.349]
MQDHPSRRLLSPAAIAGFVALLLATGGGVAWWTWNNDSTPPNALEHSQPQDSTNSGQVDDPTKTQKSATPVSPITADKTLQVYWLKATATNMQLVASPVQFASGATLEAKLAAAMAQLVAGPTQTEVSSTIPAGTKVLDLTVKENGIHVNLSREFTTGGGSTSMEGRLAQVLYTATSLNPNAAVWLSVEGKPLTLLGGEGVIVAQPVTRKQFEKDFSL